MNEAAGERIPRPVMINPYLCLEFVHEQTGACYDERYFTDPEHRHDQDVVTNQRLQHYFAEHWPEYAGNFAGEPGYVVGVAAAYVIVAALFGGQIRYYENFHPDCSSEPLAGVSSPDEIHVPDVANTWPLSEYLPKYHALAARYGRERVTIPGFGGQGVLFPQFSGLGMHSPLTTAYKLRGMQLFADVYERPALARRIFDAVRDTYYRIFDVLIPLLGLKTDGIFFGACCSSLVSERVWREWELPAIREICEHFGARAIVHSCGRSTHVLPAICELPSLLELHLGDVTDLALARRLAPEAGIYVVPDSVAWARNPPEQTVASLEAMMAAASSGPLAFQFVMEAGLTPAVIHAAVNAVKDFNRRHGWT
jgi:hypothetical protein